MRQARVTRKTQETSIDLTLDLDRAEGGRIQTGIAFFDHMLEQIQKHAAISLMVEAKGDLDIDDHHTVEDIGICFGQALAQALGDKQGINRYGTSFVPMDETLARVVLDLSGRPYLHFAANFNRPTLGGYSTEMTREFFRAAANSAGITLHMEVLYGDNAHHQTEALYKAFGRALRQAVAVDPTVKGIPSTKGCL